MKNKNWATPLTLLLMVTLVSFLTIKNIRHHSDEKEHAKKLIRAPLSIGSDLPASKTPRKPERSSPLNPSEHIIASTGEKVILNIYADCTFDLHLPSFSKDTYVDTDKKFFSTHELGSPHGVKIKIRNGEGVILTTSDKTTGLQISYLGIDDGNWHYPATGRIEMPQFSSRFVDYGTDLTTTLPLKDPTVPKDKISSRFKLSSMTEGIKVNLKNHYGLEFKLFIAPSALPHACDASGKSLNYKNFPKYETDWLSGALLFDDE